MADKYSKPQLSHSKNSILLRVERRYFNLEMKYIPLFVKNLTPIYKSQILFQYIKERKYVFTIREKTH